MSVYLDGSTIGSLEIWLLWYPPTGKVSAGVRVIAGFDGVSAVVEPLGRLTET